jgi:hypothetical protein
MTDSDMLESQAKGLRGRVSSFLKKDGLFLGVGAFFAALLATLLVPRARMGMRKIGPKATELTHRAAQMGRERMNHRHMEDQS